jgi:pimeloyl-ACP methyl ester carboxylesterase
MQALPIYITLHYFCFSIDKIPKVSSPVLVIHGTEDDVIDFSHGLAIYEKCPRAVEPLWVEVRKRSNLLS